jgi:short-subunit dehydrogenase
MQKFFRRCPSFISFHAYLAVENTRTMTKNLIIVGMGPGMSMGMAQKFGKEGFTIGMISRSKDKLKKYQEILRSSGISAHYAMADVSDTKSLLMAIEQLKKGMGGISVLNYNANDGRFIPLLEENVEDLTKGFRISV